MTEDVKTENLIYPENETEKKSKGHERKRNLAHIIMLSVLLALLIATVILVALLALPIGEREYPVIEIKDSGGKWEDQGAVAVFGEKLRPGSSGKYEFVLKNPHDYELSYEYFLSPEFSNRSEEYFPLKFRLRMNNVVMQTEEWRDIGELSFSDLYILPGATQSFTLEWTWPFEAGTDASDTILGAKGETISMILHVGAQAR